MDATILVADDDEGLCGLLTAVLKTAGYKTLIADDGSAALELTRQHVPDIALLDVSMPGIDGFDTCRAIKSDARTAHIPVLLLTAYADSGLKVKGLDAGATDYINLWC